MKITYIGHSGFCVAIDNNLLVFDYYTDTAHIMQPALLQSYDSIFVFVSHEHYDHYNEAIYSWRKHAKNILYILSDDIVTQEKAFFLHTGQSAQPVPEMQVQAFDSTDQGISFLVDAFGKRIFHAGDLNWWHFRDESTPEEIEEADSLFFAALPPLKDSCPDIAFFPVDPRMGSGYDEGAINFCKTARPKIMIPMHFWDMPETALRFRDERDFPGTKILPLTSPGKSIDL